jgi:hypothetical protein
MIPWQLIATIQRAPGSLLTGARNRWNSAAAARRLITRSGRDGQFVEDIEVRWLYVVAEARGPENRGLRGGGPFQA